MRRRARVDDVLGRSRRLLLTSHVSTQKSRIASWVGGGGKSRRQSGKLEGKPDSTCRQPKRLETPQSIFFYTAVNGRKNSLTVDAVSLHVLEGSTDLECAPGQLRMGRPIGRPSLGRDVEACRLHQSNRRMLRNQTVGAVQSGGLVGGTRSPLAAAA